MFRIFLLLMFFFFDCKAQDTNDILILNDDLLFELENMVNKDQKYRVMMSSDSLTFNTAEKDSLWLIQNIIDEENTKRLIEIVSDKGFIHSSKTNSNSPVYIIFMHSPFKYKSKILEIINKAKKNNRIDSAAYGLINWHINGRKELILNPH